MPRRGSISRSITMSFKVSSKEYKVIKELAAQFGLTKSTIVYLMVSWVIDQKMDEFIEFLMENLSWIKSFLGLVKEDQEGEGV